MLPLTREARRTIFDLVSIQWNGTPSFVIKGYDTSIMPQKELLPDSGLPEVRSSGLCTSG